jgi:hypothetical protein
VPVPAADYTVTFDPAFNYVEVRFNSAGLALLGANRAATVNVTINTVANAAGEIANTAYLFPNVGSVSAHDNPPAGLNPHAKSGPWPGIACWRLFS